MTWYVIDGIDGSGKTTSGGMLAGILESEGRKVLKIEHPNRDTFIGRMEAKFLTVDGKPAKMVSTALYIMDVVRSVWIMKRRGDEYDDVVFIRYIMSVAYLSDRPAGIAYRLFSKILPTPDVRILVDVDEHVATSRILARGDELESFEVPEKLGKIRHRMKGLADGWYVVDNSGDPSDAEHILRDIAGRSLES